MKLSDSRCEQLLRKYDIPFARHMLTKDAGHAAKAASALGYPVVLKVSSNDVLHKTETGGVVTDVRNDKETVHAFDGIMKSVRKKVPKARIDGVLVQHMFPDREVIIGAKRDPQFGPVLMFGLGGVFVEIMKDVSFRLAPVDMKEIREMVREIKGYPVLKGVRGQRPVNFRALERCMLGVSSMIWENNNIQEMDINPLMINEREAMAVDVRILGK